MFWVGIILERVHTYIDRHMCLAPIANTPTIDSGSYNVRLLGYSTVW